MRYTRVKDKNGEIHLAAFEKEETVFFLDELFPELKGKTLIDFVHMVNGDPQKAAQMICAADGSVHRMEEQEMLTPIERPVHDILCVGVDVYKRQGKLEIVNGRIYQAIARYIEVDEKPYVIELKIGRAHV